jgi:hypothetical protein
MVEEISEKLMSFEYHAEKKILLLNSSGIRKIFEKNILKILQKGEGFFHNLQESRFLDLLMEKLEQLVDKDTKAKLFK